MIQRISAFSLTLGKNLPRAQFLAHFLAGQAWERFVAGPFLAAQLHRKWVNQCDATGELTPCGAGSLSA